MSDGLYVGMNGAAARTIELDAIADNLANLNTPAFKAERPAFASLLAAEQNGSRGAIDHVHAATVATALDMRVGLTTPTGRSLDIVPKDDGFMAVMLPDGRTAYTRQGALNVNPAGLLCSLDRPVLGLSGAPIAVPQGQRVTISDEGYVRVGDLSTDRLALYRLTGGIDRLGEGLLGPGKGGSVTAMPDIRVRTGALEQSNVNALESTVALVNAQRNFESSMQALQTYRRLDEKMAETGRAR